METFGMNVKFLNPFIEATYEIIKLETGYEMQHGQLDLETDPYLTDDLTVIISLVGAVEGNVMYSMSKQTVLELVSRLMGQSMGAMDPMVQSGIAELGNVITGRAGIKLAQQGYETNISPPTLLVGKGAAIYTLDISRVVVPLFSNDIAVKIHLALRASIRGDTGTLDLEGPSVPR
jgi:chemotaxis protein CheX